MTDPATIQTDRAPRLRLATQVAARAVATDPGTVPLAVVPMALWFGMVTGLLELGLTLAWKRYYDPAPGFFRGNRHVVWIIPVVNLCVFAACGLVLAMVARWRPRLAPRLAASVLGFLASLTLLLTIKGLYPVASAALAGGLAWRVAPWLVARATPLRRLIRLSSPGLVVAVGALVALSYGREAWTERGARASLPPAASGAPNVLLIVMDTVRADHLSLYGYARDTTPSLRKLARRGVRFEHARSTAPWTLPSHASLFTGRWPHELSAGALGPLDGRYPTLAEALRDEGYATAGFVANTLYCSAEAGLARGFIHYEDHILSIRGIVGGSALGRRVLDKALDSAQGLAAAVGLGAWLGPGNGKPFKDAATINGELLAWLDGRGDRPFFAFLNFFDAHDPYLLPVGHDRHFGLRPETHADRAILSRWWGLGKRRLAPRDVALARDAYDDCLAYLDEQLGRLFDELDRRGVLDNTLVIVTADHGEHFGEHELYGHGGSLYEPEVHVPLLIAGPSDIAAGTTVGERVSLRDLPATVTDLLGLGRRARFPGASLARCWRPNGGADSGAAGPMLSEMDNPLRLRHANGGRSPAFRGPMKALADADLVYIRNGDGREELYDLAADPRQQNNLVGTATAGPSLERSRAGLERLLREGAD